MRKTFSFLIEGGKCSGGPPLGPSLSPLGVNVMLIVNKVNELTREFAGMRVPVKVSVDVETKEFDVSVGVPTVTALIAREAKMEKGSGTPHTQKVGDISMGAIVKIAKAKWPKLYAKTFKAAVKEVLGSARSVGVSVDGRDPYEVLKDVDQGVYDDLIEKYGEGED